MSELKLEDLKVGDKLEFVSEECREEYKQDNIWSPQVEALFIPSNIVINVERHQITLRGEISEWENTLSRSDLKYFRKVEQLDKETPYVLVDAGIKDYVESYTRQMAGERFMFGDKQMWFDSKDGNFMCDDKLAGIYKSEYRNFKVKKPWYETASESNPILCKVENMVEVGTTMKAILYIKGINTEGKFIDNEVGDLWENATPVKASECFDYNNKEK